jgi:hypothetical protein
MGLAPLESSTDSDPDRMSLSSKQFTSGFVFSSLPVQPFDLKKKEERHSDPRLNAEPNQSKKDSKRNIKFLTEISEI